MSKLDRECGRCTLCCKVLAIKELDKPKGINCGLVQIGKGCGDYENRPPSCREFECLWLMGLLPNEFKPRITHMVGDATSDGNRIVLHVDPDYPNAADNEPCRSLINQIVDRGIDVIIACGDRRSIRTSNPDTVCFIQELT